MKSLSDLFFCGHQNCYFNLGFNYRGQLSITKSGAKCAPWTTAKNNNLYPLGKNGIGPHNFCRNPDNEETGLWCYVYSDEYVEFCNATICPESYKQVPNITLGRPDDDDDENETVTYLYGPIISGVCGGVVALLLFIGIGEYLRRKGYFTKKPVKDKKREKFNNTKINTSTIFSNNNGFEEEDDHPEENIRPLGGVVTVNLDTGEQKRQSGRYKHGTTRSYASNDAREQEKSDSKSMYSVKTYNSSLGRMCDTRIRTEETVAQPTPAKAKPLPKPRKVRNRLPKTLPEKEENQISAGVLTSGEVTYDANCDTTKDSVATPKLKSAEEHDFANPLFIDEANDDNNKKFSKPQRETGLKQHTKTKTYRNSSKNNIFERKHETEERQLQEKHNKRPKKAQEKHQRRPEKKSSSSFEKHNKPRRIIEYV